MKTIGFIQGRLSPITNGKIQCFPWDYWQEEFKLANECRLHLMEWTLDQERLYNNPLMNAAGQNEIKGLMEKYKLTIPSLTGDCFMQMPFYKENDKKAASNLIKDFINIIEACGELGITFIVMPLVDNGKLENERQIDLLKYGLNLIKPSLKENKVKIIFESDFSPKQLARFIEEFDHELFGINYDIGNSAALGFNPIEEITAYGHRILNVHVKDRKLNDGTVPLGKGAADFSAIFKVLKDINYNGNYILQTARAENNNHINALCKYRDMVEQWI